MGGRAPLSPKAEQSDETKKKTMKSPKVLATPTIGLMRPPVTEKGMATAMTTKQIIGAEMMAW